MTSPGTSESDYKPSAVECLAAIAVHLSRIADVLEHTVRSNEPDDIRQVQVDDSIGDCPQCKSISVTQQGSLPTALFKCNQCNFIWINNNE